ncbi:MAG: argininosuccinate lyase [Spirochaetes bacterium]|nr:MAG: argininosuccinate lyase [Spirochaetota bacterium]
MKIRDGRLKKPLSKSFEHLNSSIGFDIRLAKYDIAGSIAYAKALKRVGIITDKEMKSIINGLETIQLEIENGKFVPNPENEDIHMNIEMRLLELVGTVALKLHTGRSRNEQIVLDERLYLIDALKNIKSNLKNLLKSLYLKAKNSRKIIMPSYTHLQQAQLISASHLLLAYYRAIYRDHQRLLDIEKRLNEMPLGSGAVAGSSIGIDREFLLKELGFISLTKNSIDAVSNRDFIIEFEFILTSIFLTLSRISEDFIIYSTQEFGFIILPDELTTTSSLMPQKKNPDSLELIRGKSTKIIGNLFSIITLLKALPYSYNRDLQEDKPGLFESIDWVLVCIDVMREIIDGLSFNDSRIKEVIKGSKDYIFATDIADYLVQRGMPFREAHQIVGKIVSFSESNKKRLSEIKIEEYKKFSPLFDKDIYKVFDPVKSVNNHNVYGGTAINRIDEILNEIEEELKNI